MNNFYIYAHRSITTNKIFYIGKGKDNRAYIKRSRNNIWNQFAKTGYTIEIIKKNISEQKAYDIEHTYIKSLKILGYCQANLYVGKGVVKIRRDKNSFLPKSTTISAKEFKITKPLLSGKNSHLKRQVIDIITKEVWSSVSEAAKHNKIKQPTLNRYLNGKRFNPTNLRFLGE